MQAMFTHFRIIQLRQNVHDVMEIRCGILDAQNI